MINQTHSFFRGKARAWRWKILIAGGIKILVDFENLKTPLPKISRSCCVESNYEIIQANRGRRRHVVPQVEIMRANF
jgi:hypothetical protein